MATMRQRVDQGGAQLRSRGEWILQRLRRAYAERESGGREVRFWEDTSAIPFLETALAPYGGAGGRMGPSPTNHQSIFGMLRRPIPYEEFRRQLDSNR